MKCFLRFSKVRIFQLEILTFSSEKSYNSYEGLVTVNADSTLFGDWCYHGISKNCTCDNCVLDGEPDTGESATGTTTVEPTTTEQTTFLSSEFTTTTTTTTTKSAGEQ